MEYFLRKININKQLQEGVCASAVRSLAEHVNMPRTVR